MSLRTLLRHHWSAALIVYTIVGHCLGVIAKDGTTISGTPALRGLGVGTHLQRNANWDVDKVLPLMKQMGVSLIREELLWHAVETTKGTYALPPKAEHWFTDVTGAGIQVWLVLDYGNRLYENPLDPVAYSNYVAWAARTFKGKVVAYELWNEPSNFYFRKQYGGERSGANDALWVRKYSELVRIASAAIRQVDPQAVILHNLDGAPWYYTLQRDPKDYVQVDGIDVHPYPTRYPAETVPHGPEQEQQDGVSLADADHSLVSLLDIRSRRFPMKFLGRSLQCWVGEYGFTTYQPTEKTLHYAASTEQEQAAYLVRGLMVGLSAGVKAWCIYDFVCESDNATNPESNFGLVCDSSHNYAPKPAFYALQRTARLLGSDWKLAADVPAKLEVDLGQAPPASDPWVKINGPQMQWFRVGKDYVTVVWRAGKFTDAAPPRGQIVWPGAPNVSAVEALDLVSGQAITPSITREPNGLRLSGVPVGSSPVAIHWILAGTQTKNR